MGLEGISPFSSFFALFFAFMRNLPFFALFFAFLRFILEQGANNCNLLEKWGISLRPRLHRPRWELPELPCPDPSPNPATAVAVPLLKRVVRRSQKQGVVLGRRIAWRGGLDRVRKGGIDPPIVGSHLATQRGNSAWIWSQEKASAKIRCPKHLKLKTKNDISLEILNLAWKLQSLGVVLPHLLGEIFRTTFSQNFIKFSLLVEN